MTQMSALRRCNGTWWKQIIQSWPIFFSYQQCIFSGLPLSLVAFDRCRGADHRFTWIWALVTKILAQEQNRMDCKVELALEAFNWTKKWDYQLTWFRCRPLVPTQEFCPILVAASNWSMPPKTSVTKCSSTTKTPTSNFRALRFCMQASCEAKQI